MLDEPALESRAPTADDLSRCVSELVNAVARGIERKLQPWGFSALEFTILRLCYQAGSTTVTSLAAAIPVDSGRISRVVNNLYNKGLIKRERMVSDRRVVQLQLSDDGLTTVPLLLQLIEDYNNMLIAGISLKEMTQFISTSHKIVANHAHYQAGLESGVQAPA